MDLGSITAGLAAIKTGFDTAKTGLGIVADLKNLMPQGSSERQRAETALAHASEKLAEGEAAVAVGLGYTLCRCAYPPTVMLKVGHLPIRNLSGTDKGQVLSQNPVPGGGLTGSIAVHECPRCKQTDAPGYKFERFAVTAQSS